jgi:CubicO group peptidase (beta-lactamase class C family)
MKDHLDFSSPIPVNARTASLHALLEAQIQRGLHPAAQMVVAKGGEVLYDQALGFVHGSPTTRQIPFFTFSCTKAFTAVCIHKLIEEGKIELDAPVVEYWPQFGVNGKASTTIRHVLTHHAGLPWGTGEKQVPLWPFWRLVTWDIARTPPEYPPGEKFAYHVVSYGFILGEVLRQVTGTPIHKYFEQQFAKPLGMTHSWLKLPLRKFRGTPQIQSGSEDQDNYLKLFNHPLVRTASVPAASLHSTARDMAVFYHMLVNGGAYRGRRYLNAETIKQATTLAFEGWDHFLDRQIRYALGFYLSGLTPPEGEPGPAMGEGSSLSSFGHFGNRSCMAWGDHEHGLVVIFLCNRLLSTRDTNARWTEISNQVWKMIG